VNISIRRFAALAAVAPLVALAACGGDDEPVVDPATTEAPDVTEAVDEAADFEGPTVTVSDEVPEDFVPAVGPMEITGDILALYEPGEIPDDPVLGMDAPTALGVGFDGEPVRVDAVKDGPTMIVFLAHWCPHCNDEVPMINEMQADGRLPADLNVIGIATASDPTSPNFPPGEWLDDKDWVYPAMPDGVDTERSVWLAQEAYGIRGYPFTVLVDDDGTVAARWSGSVTPEVLRERVDRYLGIS